ncbi:Stress responsive A/B Barrel domain-containing protein [Carex littledalei]|uniref:Stress responsive A/B Barrel domain-containing protein n=1 Tax=Carex littledalei TaxID=544730 RepID=A0A833VDQ2_9POAL|nr:Stress responsive A/B Barrel domain-containing protein [Carex littledalei]
MAEVKHLVVAKFKEGVVVEEILQGMTQLVSTMDMVKSFEWGTEMIGEEMLRQGFTHVFIMTFNNGEDLASYFNHPSHNDFIGTFQAALENALVFDFPAVVIKAPA